MSIEKLKKLFYIHFLVYHTVYFRKSNSRFNVL